VPAGGGVHAAKVKSATKDAPHKKPPLLTFTILSTAQTKLKNMPENYYDK